MPVGDRPHRFDPVRVGQAECATWVSYYDADPDAVRLAAKLRAEAADLSDAWVAAGCRLEDPQLAREREALIASYAALRELRGRGAAR